MLRRKTRRSGLVELRLTYTEPKEFGLQDNISTSSHIQSIILSTYIIPDKGNTLGRVGRSATVWLLVVIISLGWPGEVTCQK